MRTLIRGGDVVAWEGGSHRVIRGGDLVLEGDRVAFVGRGYDGPADTVEDASGRLVSPGFVNVHCEADLSHGPLWDDAAPVNLYAMRPGDWLWDPAERAVLTPEEVRAGARLSMGTALRCGTTTIVGINTMVLKRWDDPPWEPDLFAEVADELGVRAYLSHHYRAGVVVGGRDGPEIAWNEEAGRRGLERAVAFIERLRRRPDRRVEGLLFPYTLDTASPALLRATRDAARRLGVPIRMHFAQSRFEVEQVRARWGATPVGLVEETGLAGPDLILTHALHIAEDDEADLERLARAGVTIAHCPVVQRRTGRVLRSFSRYRRAGLNVALGTDTFPPDMIEEMRWAALASKVADGHPASGLAREVYEAATIAGARALGRDDLGRLAPGAKADVTVIDLRRLHSGPSDDPIRALVHYAVPPDVERVFVDGRAVVRDGRVLGIDERAVLLEAGRATARMIEQFVAWSGRTVEELSPPSCATR